MFSLFFKTVASATSKVNNGEIVNTLIIYNIPIILQSVKIFLDDVKNQEDTINNEIEGILKESFPKPS